MHLKMSALGRLSDAVVEGWLGMLALGGGTPVRIPQEGQQHRPLQLRW